MSTTRRRYVFHFALALISIAACAPRASRPPGPDLDVAGERYVRLVLAMGRHDGDYVDAFYGPAQWKRDADRDSVSLGVIRERADSLAAILAASPPSWADTMVALRHRYLQSQLEALSTRARILKGDTLSYDAESKALYDAVAPPLDEASLAPVFARLDSLLPGRGPLGKRWEAYHKTFMIPPARIDTVFKTALAEARRRTLAHMTLPDSESFTIEYVRGQPWSGYNWYQGGARSLIQVNVDLPIPIERAIDLACHEGYPGHHVYNALLEQALVRDRGWKEFTVYPLFSPLALIAEGTATVAPEVAFSPEERARFEKETLYPLAGLDPSRYERYEIIRAAFDSLGRVGVEGARRWLDGRITREQVIEWRMRYALQTRERAEKSARFDERYRSYGISYELGKDLVREWLAANGGDAGHPERRWQLYQTLLASPRLPTDLRTR